MSPVISCAAELADFEPAGWHCDLVEELRADGLAGDAERVDAVLAVSRVVAAAYAQMCELVAECDPREDDGLREEIASALRLSAFAADQMLLTGRALAHRLPATREALRTGTISYDHARRIASGLTDVDDETVARIEAGLVVVATGTTPGRLARAVERAVIAAAPDAADEAAAAAAEGRDVTVHPDVHGMAVLVARMPAAAAQEVFLALDTAADRDAGDRRGRGARRADALHSWARAALASGDLPTRHGRPATVLVTMSAETALGLSGKPAELAGYGPITARVARAIAAEGEWRALVTDAATGRVLRLGGPAYRPSQALRDELLARFETCSFPGCGRPSAACDIDHRRPYAEGGATDADNCAPLCRRHHRLKTHGGWRVEARDDGTLRWTSPQHRDYDVGPPIPVPGARIPPLGAGSSP